MVRRRVYLVDVTGYFGEELSTFSLIPNAALNGTIKAGRTARHLEAAPGASNISWRPWRTTNV